MKLPKLTVWRAIFASVLLSGVYATYLRIFKGLGGSTNLSDQFPWGIWIGFDVMCGVGLAAGGFTLVAIVHIFNIENRMEKPASNTMTRKIDSTTDRVVSRPTLPASPSTRSKRCPAGIRTRASRNSP